MQVNPYIFSYVALYPKKTHKRYIREQRFAFNGQEKDDELLGEGNAYAFEYRIHDARIGRFFSVDPLAPKYPMYTPYSFAANQPIHAGDLEGLENPNDKNPARIYDPNSKDVIEVNMAGIQGMVNNNPEQTKSATLRLGLWWLEVLTPYAEVACRIHMNKENGGNLTTERLDQIYPGTKDYTLLHLATEYFVGRFVGKIVGPLFSAAIKKGDNLVLDFFGGPKSNLPNGLSIDPAATNGFKGTIQEFAAQNQGKLFKSIQANNPYGYAGFIDDAAVLLDDGGTITVRGTMSNKYFAQVANGTASGLDNFVVIKNAAKVSDAVKAGMKTTNGVPIQGDVYEIILKKIR